MTTESECLDALWRAAEELGRSPTKAEYEKLGLQPASATIIRVVGGWNEAKERAGLETFEQARPRGSGVDPKPEDVSIPDDLEWKELTGQQRWYYKNKESRIARKDERREQLRSWLHAYKRDNCVCARCDEGHPACLDFHHPGEKVRGIAEMVVYGYSKENIRSEMERCTVLCANCHRKEHYRPPTDAEQ